MADAFDTDTDSVADPARAPFAITPSDSEALTTIPKAILVGGAGTVVLRGVDGVADVSVTVVAGQLLPIRARYVRATGTTATGLVGLA